MKFKELSDWTTVKENCAARYKKNGNINNPADVVAIISKMPGVRIDKGRYAVESHYVKPGMLLQKNDAWIFGIKDSECGASQKSRDWCDQMLILLGWEQE